MSPRQTIEERLAAVAAAREDPESEASRALLAKELASKASHVVAAAAHVVGELHLEELGRLLPAAFQRFLRDPVKTDPQCAAKLAIAEALAELDAPTDDLFIAGLRYRQPEPVWGGTADTAAALRATCAVALVNLGHPDALRYVAVLLADPERDARAGALQALGFSHQPEAAIPLLRFKAALGDEDPEVARECVSSLLGLDGDRSLQFAAELLHRDQVTAEAAALAIGASRLTDAFGVLRDFHEEQALGDLRRVAALAIAMLRSDDAMNYLLEVAADASTGAAVEAVSALAIHKHDPGVRTRVADAVAARDERAVQEAFERAFALERT